MATKQVKQAAVEINTKVQDQTIAADVTEMSAYESAVQAVRELGMFLPGWKRTLLSFIASFCVGYGIGYVASILIDMVFLATPMFFAYILSAIILCATLYAAIKAGQTLGMYIATGNIDRDIVTAKNKVMSWFESKRKVIAV